MHALTFEIKKMHLGVVGFGKRVLADVPGMTPARFDLMFAIMSMRHDWGHVATPSRYELPQRVVQEALGLHASTVSKLITRLAALGWLTRERFGGDRRQKLVRLTDAGYAAVKLAMRIVMKRRFFRRWLRPIFLPHAGRHRCAERRTQDEIALFYDACGVIAERLGRGRTPLPWPPPYED